MQQLTMVEVDAVSGAVSEDAGAGRVGALAVTAPIWGSAASLVGGSIAAFGVAMYASY